MTLSEKLKKISVGLVCLVPKMGAKEIIVCHERTLCDCEVLKLIDALEKCRDQRDHWAGWYIETRDGRLVLDKERVKDDTELLKILDDQIAEKEKQD